MVSNNGAVGFKIFTADGQELSGIDEVKMDFVDETDSFDTKNIINEPMSLEIPIVSIKWPVEISYSAYRDLLLFHQGNYKQKRTHKKARINKKYAKKYGYVRVNESEESI